MKVGDVVRIVEVVDVPDGDDEYKSYKGRMGVVVGINQNTKFKYIVDIGEPMTKTFMEIELKHLVGFPSKNIYEVNT